MDGHQLAMALRAAYLSMHRQAEAALQPFGVTANQFVVLWTLAEEDGVTQRVLAERTSSDANTIRPVLAALEQRRYIERAPHPADARAWCVKLTRTGRSAFEKMRQGSEAFRRRLIGSLDKREAEHLVQLLERVSVVMGQSQTGQPSQKITPRRARKQILI